MKLKFYGSLLGALGIGAVLGTPAFAGSYTFTDLGTFTGSSTAQGINNAGTVVGYANNGASDGTSNAANQAFIYSSPGPLANADSAGDAPNTTGGKDSQAFGINSGGVAAGTETLSGDAASRAVTFSGGVVTNLGTAFGSGGAVNSSAAGINDSGEVVGTSNVTSSTLDAVLWKGGTPTDLGRLPTGTTSEAFGINNTGSVVGDSTIDPAGATTHAFVWVPTVANGTTGTMFDLGTGTNYSQASAINSVGQTTGQVADPNQSGNTIAFLHSGTGPILAADEIPLLPGGTISDGFAINNSGNVVGFGDTTGSALHGFLYNGTSIIDLNSLLPVGSPYTVVSGNGIDASGDIVGYATSTADAFNHAFLLKAVQSAAPEPSPVAAFVVGALGLGLVARKARKAGNAA